MIAQKAHAMLAQSSHHWAGSARSIGEKFIRPGHKRNAIESETSSAPQTAGVHLGDIRNSEIIET